MAVLRGLWFELQRLNRNIELLLQQEKRMAQAVDAFKQALASFSADLATYRQQEQAKLDNMKTAIDAAVKAQQDQDDAAFADATSQLNAAHADLAAHIDQAPSLPTPPPDAPQG
jgi:recombinational DNA repair ATPase RecF